MKYVVVVALAAILLWLLWLMLGRPGTPSSRQRAHAPQNEAQPVRISGTRRFAVPVLLYHRVDDLDAGEAQNRLARDLTVSPADFTTWIRMLLDQGYTVLTKVRDFSTQALLDDTWQPHDDADPFPVCPPFGWRFCPEL